MPNPAAVDDRAILEKLRSGHADARAEAFDAVYTAFRRPVYALCVNLTRDRSQAEDAFQDCFLGVHRALPKFRGDARLSTWVYRIALRSALRVRAARTRSEPLGEDHNAPSNAPSPETVVDARLRSDRVKRAMDGLPAEQRAVLSLFAVEGLRHQEIADVLGIPVGTVWSRLSLARKKLAAALAEA